MPKGKKNNAEKRTRTEQGMTGLANRHPDNLLWQQARVALLRVLLSEPKAILLDEPFSKLDTQLRLDIRQQVFAQIRRHQLPALW